MSLIILFILSAIIASNHNSTPKLLQEVIRTENHALFTHGTWSMYAKNLKSGETLVDVNGHKSVIPASNVKLLTSAVALDLLGENFQANTRLEYSGFLPSGGALEGNVFLRGRGDPTLGSSDFQLVPALDSLGNLLVSAIQSVGIRQINGDIIGDDSYFDYMPLPGAWNWSDIGNYYAANTSGLCINENLYYLYFKPANYVGGPAQVLRTEPQVSNLRFFNHMRTGPIGSGDKGFIYAAPWQYVHQLEGTIPAGHKEFSIKGALPDPAQFAAEYLKARLEESGIRVSGKAITMREYGDSNLKTQLISIIPSPLLKDIVFQLNKKSVNLYAEQLLKMIGREVGKSGDFDTGIAVIEEWLVEKGINTDGVLIYDGSGLSYANRFTAHFFVALLEKMHTEQEFGSFYNSLPIAGLSSDPGTITHMCKNSIAAGNLRAKTGTRDRVRAHSGYVHSRSGELIAFSMIANDHSGSSRAVDRLHEKIMIQLASLP
jgi:D-alanyl-D-alanine carboxypeptidase/D-alanyl-D-alanine-endopeptidase (penicillin-binding protein 4)